MLNRLWRAVDRVLPTDLKGCRDPERRARGRLVAAIGLAVALLGGLSAPIDALVSPVDGAIDLAVGALGVALVVVQRRTGRVRLAAVALVMILAFLGVGVSALYPEPGDANLGWVLVMGLVPMLSPSFAFTGLAALGVIVAAFIVATRTPSAPSLAPFGEVVPLVVASWFAMYCVLHTHRQALAEHAAGLAGQRNLEATLDAETRLMLAQAAETAGFLTTVSHELRAPLNGVIGLADVLAHEVVGAPERAELDRIRRAGFAVLRAFDTLLRLARTTAKGAPASEPCDLHGVLDAALFKAAHSFGVPAGRFVLALAADTPRVVQIDVVVLRIVLDQVIGSALDAGAPRVHVAAGCEGGQLRVVISGQGGNPCAAADMTDDRSPLSLGLPLADQLVCAAGGSFSVGPSDTAPCSVAITLPCAPGFAPSRDGARGRISAPAAAAIAIDPDPEPVRPV